MNETVQNSLHPNTFDADFAADCFFSMDLDLFRTNPLQKHLQRWIRVELLLGHNTKQSLHAIVNRAAELHPMTPEEVALVHKLIDEAK